MIQDEPDNVTDTDEPSRSQRRREALAVFELAEALVILTSAQLERLPLSDELREEITRTQRITQQIARQCQMQFLAKQMRRREDELEPIRAALAHDRYHGRREIAELHRLEAWRERLLAEGDQALGELLQHFPQTDHQHLRQLVRQAQSEAQQQKSPRAYRELFHALRKLFEDASDTK